MATLGLVGSPPLRAQDRGPVDLEPPLRLDRTGRLQETIPAHQRGRRPTLIEADRLSGRTALEAQAEGGVVLRRGDTLLRADRLDYQQPDDLARARGHVRINRGGDRFEGPELELEVDAFRGFFTAPRYRLLKNEAHGEARRIDFLGQDRAAIREGSYTTCQRDNEASWRPAWRLTARDVYLDNENEVGQAYGARLEFFGVPVVPVPYLSFPLTARRKSGLLPPTTGGDSVNGTILAVPYYWNIAPERDATITGTLMGRRGAELTTDFRYLEPDYRGRVLSTVLPGDRLRGRDRWALALDHGDSLRRDPWPASLGGLSLKVHRVSDDDYWRDFQHGNGAFTQRLLASEASVQWRPAARWSVNTRVLAWQTLQSPDAPIIPPYDRLPQVVTRYNPMLPGGLDLAIEADATHFESRPALTGQPNAQRMYLQTALSRTWREPGWYFTPRVRLHARHYAFDGGWRLPDTGVRVDSAQRVVPTASLDGGLFLERDTRLFGRELLQTLEPRLYYVYTPLRQQNNLPNYDTGATDFSFATLFADNAFSGHDRISDNNLLTLGLTSRLQDAATGAQLARVGVAQRLRLTEQRVTLGYSDPPAVEQLSDVLAGAGVHWNARWATDVTAQYSPRTRRSERSTLTTRFTPSNYRVVQAAYRFQRNANEQVDLSWQWPLNDLWGDPGRDLGPGRGQGGGRWYSVGRLNLNLVENRLIDSLVGFEYDGCCWVGRVVVERQRVGTVTATTRLMFQLEMIGFSRLGNNVLGALRENIPRYQLLHGPGPSPSRFTQYD
jgi:LPS-assembly protein